MAISYLKKSPKTSSTDDNKTTGIVQDLLNGANGPPTGNYIPVPVNVPIYIDGPCNEWSRQEW